ncbi:hypothetical protein RI367_008626 [Sorochytrium milnesiophthora]
MSRGTFDATSVLTAGDDRDRFTISLFFGLLFALIVLAVLFFYASYRRKPEHVRRLEVLELEYESHRLVSNFHLQLQALRSLPRWWDWRAMTGSSHTLSNVGSWLAVLMFIISIVLIIVSLTSSQPYGPTYDANRMMLAAILMFTLSANTFMICRQHVYYREKQHKRDLYASASRMSNASQSRSQTGMVSSGGSVSLGNGGGTNTTFDKWSPDLAPTTLSPPPPPPPALTTAAAPTAATAFEEGYEHVTYYTFNWSFRNLLQIATLLVELFQLISLPLRDLFNNDVISSADSVQIVNAGFSYMTLIPDQISTTVLYEMEFWTFFGFTLLSILVVMLVHAAHSRWEFKLPMFWVFFLVPVAAIFYLPVLVSFVSSAACLSGSNVQSQALRCQTVDVSRTMYIICSLVGFLTSYILFTTFLVADERKPIEGDVTFRSASVAFMKNASFLLVIVFLLVPGKRAVVRGILSTVIVVSMLTYNIRWRSCFVYQINLSRSLSLTLVLWTIIAETLVNDDEILMQLSLSTVIAGFVVGYLVILVVFGLVYKRQIDRKVLRSFERESEVSLDPAAAAASHNGQRPTISMTMAGDGSRRHMTGTLEDHTLRSQFSSNASLSAAAGFQRDVAIRSQSSGTVPSIIIGSSGRQPHLQYDDSRRSSRSSTSQPSVINPAAANTSHQCDLSDAPLMFHPEPPLPPRQSTSVLKSPVSASFYATPAAAVRQRSLPLSQPLAALSSSSSSSSGGSSAGMSVARGAASPQLAATSPQDPSSQDAQDLSLYSVTELDAHRQLHRRLS